MDFHDKDFFDRMMTLTEENNELLHKMWRAARMASAMRTLYWLVIIGLSIGAYYYVQPYIEQLLSVYTGLQDSVGSVQSLIGSFKRP